MLCVSYFFSPVSLSPPQLRSVSVESSRIQLKVYEIKSSVLQIGVTFEASGCLVTFYVLIYVASIHHGCGHLNNGTTRHDELPRATCNTSI